MLTFQNCPPNRPDLPYIDHLGNNIFCGKMYLIIYLKVQEKEIVVCISHQNLLNVKKIIFDSLPRGNQGITGNFIMHN